MVIIYCMGKYILDATLHFYILKKKLVSKKLQKALEYKVKTCTNTLEQKKRHSLPGCNSSLNKFVKNTDRTTGVSFLSH